MTHRTVRTRWTGGMRAVSDAGGFEIIADEPEAHGGTDSGPQPTDLLLASVSSCIALATAFVARKRGIDLPGLDVTVVGSYDGLRFGHISVSLSSNTPREVLEELIPEVKRVCYVSNTLLNQPELVIDVG